MDAFFASVEERENPDLVGKPVIVVGSASPRSVVCAANYAVRKFGVHSAMSVSLAKRLCPHAEVVTARPSLYRQASKNVFSICETFTDLLEISSIDECYMDMTPTEERFGGALEAARMLKEKIQKTERLTCTIGVAPNKLLAKLAAGMNKPNGLFRILPADIQGILATLPLSALHGIGKKTESRLMSMGFTSAADLGRADRVRLRREIGVTGDRLVDMGQGVDDSPVVPYYERPPAKSISHESTLSEDTVDIELLKRNLYYLSERVAHRLRKQGVAAGTLGLVLRFGDLRRITRSRTISEPTDDGLVIYQSVLPLLEEVLKTPMPIRLIGVSASSLAGGVTQLGLFEDSKRSCLMEVVDEVNEKFGKTAIRPASLLNADKRDHITFKG